MFSIHLSVNVSVGFIDQCMENKKITTFLTFDKKRLLLSSYCIVTFQFTNTRKFKFHRKYKTLDSHTNTVLKPQYPWLSLLLVLVLALKGFSPGPPVFLPPQKLTFLNSNSTWNSRATGLSVTRLLSVTLVKKSLFIYLFYFVLFSFVCLSLSYISVERNN